MRLFTTLLCCAPLLAQAADLAQLRGEAEALIPPFQQQLLASVQTAVATGGPAQAVEACRQLAPGIAQQHSGQTVMVVTHGGVLDMIWRTARGTGLEGPRQSDIPNAGLNRVRVSGEAVEVLDWADVRHLADLPEQPVYDQTKLVVR